MRGFEMGGARESRQYPRFDLPVLIESPVLSDVPLVPEDISAGGFMVVVPEKPEVEGVVDCTLQVLGGIFHGCRAKVMWARENGEVPGAWTAGLSVELEGPDRDRLAAMLESLLSEFRKPS